MSSHNRRRVAQSNLRGPLRQQQLRVPPTYPDSWEIIRSHDSGNGQVNCYVAISHVWADGTGSQDGNSLYSCQLAKFQEAVDKLYASKGETTETIPFWADTISVPAKKSSLEMLALRQMEQVYREADRVLVFDAGLQQVSLNLAAHECLSRIEGSAWNERLWTIQEANFAKNLHFRFSDGIISLEELVLRYRLERFARIGALRFGDSAELLLARIPLLKIVLNAHLAPFLSREDHEAGELCTPADLAGAEDKSWLALDATALEKPISKIESEGLRLDGMFYGTVVAVSGFFDTLSRPKRRHVDAQSMPLRYSLD